MTAGPAPFGRMPDGRAVERFRIAGGRLTADILTYGATVQDLRLDGIGHPLVLGAPELAPYLQRMPYFGAIVGRFANRIAGGRFRLDGRDCRTDRNFRGRHTLHGGSIGTGQRLWQLQALRDDSATLALDLADGEMGFPGAMQVTATYTLTADDALQVEIAAETDAATPCSFAHHSYFNLDGGADICGHRLRVDADRYLPVDADLIPAGQPAPVAGTPFDFRTPRPIGRHGIDHNFCLSDVAPAADAPLRTVARLSGTAGGLHMDIETAQPGLQAYDGAQFDGLPGLEGRRYGAFAGITLESQAWPDAPNRPDFPAAILRPGQRYRNLTRYVFGRD
ncbi:aldose epimerase family protein [Marinibaculum pumilum]|uniref:Aldose 1-epimerase n=1 Tax=Marinibaculum pumilum TaxID=1766165 RepID=A0ABV7L042_9PROT